MFQKDNIVYAEGYKYLKHKKVRVIGFAVPGNIEDFEEADIDMDSLTIKDNEITLNGNLKIIVPATDHKSVKTKIIQSRYSNNDQIAIMLNNDSESMQHMQLWRLFAEDVAERVNKLTNE